MSLKWSLLFAAGLLFNCGGPKKKSDSSGAKVTNANEGEASGAKADQVKIKLVLFNPSDLPDVDKSMAPSLTHYEFRLSKTDPECVGFENLVDSGSLASTPEKTFHVSNKCEMVGELWYGTSATANTEENTGGVPLAPTYNNLVKEMMDQNCATAGCHAAGAIAPDLSAYDSVVASFKTEKGKNSLHRIEKKDADGGTYSSMPPGDGLLKISSDSAKTHDDLIGSLKAWIDGGFLQESASLALVADPPSAELTYFKGFKLNLRSKILTSGKPLTLMFLMEVTDAGKEKGFKSLVIQGEKYVRSAAAANSNTPAAGAGQTGGDGSTPEGGDQTNGGNQDPGGNENPGDGDSEMPKEEPLNLELTFDDVGTFLTDPAKGNCATAGCHSAADSEVLPSRPVLVTFLDYKAYIEADADFNKTILSNHIKNGTMPTKLNGQDVGVLSDAEKHMIRGWVEGDLKAGPNTDTTPPAPALSFATDIYPVIMGSCGSGAAACHQNARAQIGSFATAAGAQAEFADDTKRGIIIGRMDGVGNPMPTNGLIADRNTAPDGILVKIRAWAAGGKAP